MSQGRAVPWASASRIAGELVALLADACERIEVAGSIRRRRGEVRDIEIVAISRTEERPEGMFGTAPVDLLDEQLSRLRAERLVTRRLVEIRRGDGRIEHQERDGAAYKALEFMGLPVDLFVVRPPAEWGVIFALRTGPGDWNTKLVTECRSAMRRVEGGRVIHLGEVIPCPEEADFFRALGQPWVEPADRHVDRVRIDPQLIRAANAVTTGGGAHAR